MASMSAMLDPIDRTPRCVEIEIQRDVERELVVEREKQRMPWLDCTARAACEFARLRQQPCGLPANRPLARWSVVPRWVGISLRRCGGKSSAYSDHPHSSGALPRPRLLRWPTTGSEDRVARRTLGRDRRRRGA